MSSNSSNPRGLRVIAIFEGVKAVFLLIVGFGLLSLINRDLAATAEKIVRRLHLNPVSKYPHIFIQTAEHLTDRHLWLFAFLATIDAVVRGVLAYGLWYNRTWAKWLGVIAAGIYMPIEVYELHVHVTVFKVIVFLTNIAIVIYLGMDLYSPKRFESSQTEAQEKPFSTEHSAENG